MPQGVDLLANGMPPGLATLLGNQPQALTATGTSQGAAAQIITTLVSVTASAGQTGAVLPAIAPLGSPYYVSSVGSVAAVIYAPSTQSLNGATNGSVTFSAAVASGIFVQMSLGKWFSFPLAP